MKGEHVKRDPLESFSLGQGEPESCLETSPNVEEYEHLHAYCGMMPESRNS